MTMIHSMGTFLSKIKYHSTIGDQFGLGNHWYLKISCHIPMPNSIEIHNMVTGVKNE